MITGDPVHHGQGGLQLRPTSPLRAQATRGASSWENLGVSGTQVTQWYLRIPSPLHPTNTMRGSCELCALGEIFTLCMVQSLHLTGDLHTWGTCALIWEHAVLFQVIISISLRMPVYKEYLHL